MADKHKSCSRQGVIPPKYFFPSPLKKRKEHKYFWLLFMLNWQLYNKSTWYRFKVFRLAPSIYFWTKLHWKVCEYHAKCKHLKSLKKNIRIPTRVNKRVWHTTLVNIVKANFRLGSHKHLIRREPSRGILFLSGHFTTVSGNPYNSLARQARTISFQRTLKTSLQLQLQEIQIARNII